MHDGTDWTSVAALIASIVCLAGFAITALRGRRADDIDTLVKLNEQLRTANADLHADNVAMRGQIEGVNERVEKLETRLVKCQRENGRLRRKLVAAGV